MENEITLNGAAAISLQEVAMESYYSLTNASAITAEVSEQVKRTRLHSEPASWKSKWI